MLCCAVLYCAIIYCTVSFCTVAYCLIVSYFKSNIKLAFSIPDCQNHGFKSLFRRTLIEGDKGVPVPCPAESSTPTTRNVFASASKNGEDQAHLAARQVSQSVLSKADEELSQALAGYRRAKRCAIGAIVKSTKLADQLSDAKSFAADAKELAEVASVAATEARVAFARADDAWTEAELASATQADKVDAAARRHETAIADYTKAAAEVSVQNLRGAVKLEALGSRRCAMEVKGAALSLAAEKAARDLDEAKAGLDGSNDSLSITMNGAGAALMDLQQAMEFEAGSERDSERAAANVRSLQQQHIDAATEQEGFDAAVRQAKATLDNAKSAKELACLEYGTYR